MVQHPHKGSLPIAKLMCINGQQTETLPALVILRLHLFCILTYMTKSVVPVDQKVYCH